MSGTGKSSVIAGLAVRGVRAIDLDDGYVVPAEDGRQRWDEVRVSALLDEPRPRPLVVAGCEENMGKFLDRFDDIILLSAPLDVMLERLETRTNSDFGKSTQERQRVIDDLAGVEPLLRRIATVEIVTTIPLADVIDQVAALAQPPPPFASRHRQ